MKSKDNYKVIGIMSGTSLDGLDIACCEFTKRKSWNFRIVNAVTLPYAADWKKKISSAHLMSGSDLLEFDASYGMLIAESCARFISKNKIKGIDAIASHGHTVFHQTDRGFTFQAGNGNVINAVTGIPVVWDFRSLDVALKGQGAPLVPVGDRHLFSGYDVCLNLGGIANLSGEKGKDRIAFDICFVNMGLNYLASKLSLAYDDKGALASKGVVDKAMLNKLETYYKSLSKRRPALAREDFEKNVLPILDDDVLSVEIRLRTLCESIATEIASCISAGPKKIKILATGGGALNEFLISLITTKVGKTATVVIPERQIIDFKEALVFAFLGVLRLRGEINVLKSVTRAKADSCSGVITG